MAGRVADRGAFAGDEAADHEVTRAQGRSCAAVVDLAHAGEADAQRLRRDGQRAVVQKRHVVALLVRVQPAQRRVAADVAAGSVRRGAKHVAWSQRFRVKQPRDDAGMQRAVVDVALGAASAGDGQRSQPVAQQRSGQAVVAAPRGVVRASVGQVPAGESSGTVHLRRGLAGGQGADRRLVVVGEELAATVQVEVAVCDGGTARAGVAAAARSAADRTVGVSVLHRAGCCRAGEAADQVVAGNGAGGIGVAYVGAGHQFAGEAADAVAPAHGAAGIRHRDVSGAAASQATDRVASGDAVDSIRIADAAVGCGQADQATDVVAARCIDGTEGAGKRDAAGGSKRADHAADVAAVACHCDRVAAGNAVHRAGIAADEAADVARARRTYRAAGTDCGAARTIEGDCIQASEAADIAAAAADSARGAARADQAGIGRADEAADAAHTCHAAAGLRGADVAQADTGEATRTGAAGRDAAAGGCIDD